ncbi:alpha/beta fold hydrolase [Sphingomonas japonica]|uniref:Pimeloyl-ACP methyl ester carboxylesterase n=1 Tax=Sphingomonas japonica TaxID=511662 RepID=A0ABX0U3U9_9SPHN|nr:alpha/beta fold hydrolase [Sphingomonas japonica]NIJ25215.1 pimeloyl-ACP methyl ester carboxylesterase [Sphingomonas japonica]
MHQITQGAGKPLLLIHGLGSSGHAWRPILDDLAAKRSVIAVDLPGHGATPAEPDSGTFTGLVGSVERYLVANDLIGVDVVGSSMGARIVLELARRGKVGNVVALDPGGFWRGWERLFFRTTIGLSAQLLRVLRSRLPAISRSAPARMALLAQLSAKPSALAPEFVCTELTGITDTSTFDDLVRDLANGPEQEGPAADPTQRIVIGWGKQDRLCLPRQAARAMAAFPSATLHWFEHSGHFPMWDMPREAVAVILQATR